MTPVPFMVRIPTPETLQAARARRLKRQVPETLRDAQDRPLRGMEALHTGLPRHRFSLAGVQVAGAFGQLCDWADSRQQCRYPYEHSIHIRRAIDEAEVEQTLDLAMRVGLEVVDLEDDWWDTHDLEDLHDHITDLVDRFRRVNGEWVPRDHDDGALERRLVEETDPAGPPLRPRYVALPRQGLGLCPHRQMKQADRLVQRLMARCRRCKPRAGDGQPSMRKLCLLPVKHKATVINIQTGRVMRHVTFEDTDWRFHF